MIKILAKTSDTVGYEPGALIYVGDKKIDKQKIEVFHYGPEFLEHREEPVIDECLRYKNQEGVTWINIEGLHEVAVIEKLGEYYDLHPILMEDILNTEKRPEFADYDEYLFIVLKMLLFDESNDSIISEQLGILLGPGTVITFQEGVTGDVFNSIRERIVKKKGRVRKRGADYLTYLLMDAVIDNYYVIVEKFGSELEKFEEEVIDHASTDTLLRIHEFSRMNSVLKSYVSPTREAALIFEKSESALLDKKTIPYIKDLRDHINQIDDTMSTFKELIVGMMHVNLSLNSNKLNEIMKFLTLIASIFIPLSFIAGLYGMNFTNMPELHNQYGYPITLFLMLALALVMLVYYRKKKWI